MGTVSERVQDAEPALFMPALRERASTELVADGATEDDRDRLRSVASVDIGADARDRVRGEAVALPAAGPTTPRAPPEAT